MRSKWHGQRCPLCGSGTQRDGAKTVAHDYKGYAHSSSIRGSFCDQCGDGFPEFDATQENDWLAFRDWVDAVEATELARIRKKLKLTQIEAAQLAGGGKNAFSRYERGQARPVAAVVNLFRLLDRHPALLGELQEGLGVRSCLLPFAGV